MPTTAHFIYIPAVLVIGIVIGFILGGRAARDAFAAQKEKEAARAARRAARAQGNPSSGGAPSGGASSDGRSSSEH
jgi:hypothetical protein